jgi:hypothetical protein
MLAVMAWGYGNVGYGPFRTKKILTSRPDAARCLEQVAQTLERDGAVAAYRRLASSADCRLRGLGPSFGTKFLYFSQPQCHQVTALIFDSLVSEWLFREANLYLPCQTWRAVTYEAYLSTMQAWSRELGVRPDDVECSIFQAMAAERANQWATSQNHNCSHPPGKRPMSSSETREIVSSSIT